MSSEETRDEALDRSRGVDLQLWRRLWTFTGSYRRQVAWLIVFAIGTAACDSALPWVTKGVIDDLTDPEATLDLWHHGWIYAALLSGLAGSVLGFILVGGRLRTGVGHDIRRAGFEKLQELSFSFYDRRSVGWLVARMTSDCERLTNILAWGVLDLVWGLSIMLGVSVAMLVTDWRLGLAILGVVPVLYLVSKYFQRLILSASRLVRKTNSRLTAAYNEGIMGMRTTKTFVRERENLDEFRVVTREMNRVSVRNAVLSSVYLPLVLVLSSLATALVLSAGGERVLGAAIPLGTLILFLSYSRLFFEPVQELAHLFAEIQMAQASAERVIGLIDAEPEIADAPEVARAIVSRRGRPLPPGIAEDGLPDEIGGIEFRGVSFAYRAGGQQVLKNFDLRVEAGETIALVGSTGGGKSTILALLCRFYEPTAGSILLDGLDYRRRGLHWLQSNLGIVLQVPQLFSGTIAENIRYGDLDATDAEVEAAARLVGAEEFITALEDGYSAPVGEGGSRLSTGQKQLISFARAILKAPRILVMDEATSSIDTETEQRIQAGLNRVLAGRTSFVIAHRLSTVRSADRILVIEGGRIVEAGTHGELMARHGRYHELYTEQSLREAGRGRSDWGGGPVLAEG